MKLGRGIEILSGKHMTSRVFPKPLDDIEIRRIRRQEYEVDSEFGRLVLYCLAMLVTGIVENNGDRSITRGEPYLFKKCLCLPGIHINHRMGLYDVKGKGIHASQKIEAVPSCSGLEVKRLLAPDMAGERLQCEMDGIHEIELAFTFHGLIYNRLQCFYPFCLLLGTRFAGYGLRFYEPKATASHYFPCPCQSKRNTADVTDYMRCFDRTSRHLGFKATGNPVHIVFQSTRTSGNGGDSENGINTIVVISVNQFVNEIATASCNCSYSFATQLWFRHFGHKGTTTFAYYAGGSRFIFLFETGIRLLVIFDGEQSCIDDVKNKVVIYQRRSPSFIGYGDDSHFAQILYVLPIKENFVGKNWENYDFTMVLSHFKGHPMAGFGGALKNVAIGMASSAGKAWIHTAGSSRDIPVDWANVPPQTVFLESMAEACESVFEKAGENILFISVANNLSVDCDCVAEPAPIEMRDLGIFASLDPVALDRACVDMVYNADDEGKAHLIERMEQQQAMHLLDYAEKLGLGCQDYELIRIDDEPGA